MPEMADFFHCYSNRNASNIKWERSLHREALIYSPTLKLGITDKRI